MSSERFETYDRNTFTVQAIQVTSKNIRELAAYCESSVQQKRVGDILVEFFTISVRSPDRPTQKIDTYVGNWLTITPEAVCRYTDKKFQAIFTKRPGTDREETQKRNALVLNLVKEVMLKQDSATYHGLSHDGMDKVSREYAQKIIDLFQTNDSDIPA